MYAHPRKDISMVIVLQPNRISREQTASRILCSPEINNNEMQYSHFDVSKTIVNGVSLGGGGWVKWEVEQ